MKICDSNKDIEEVREFLLFRNFCVFSNLLLLFAPWNIIEKCITMFRGDMMEFMTASQAAKLWHISQCRVQILCAEGRIPGVFKLGEAWAISANVEKPTDKRKKMENDGNEHT